MDYHPCYFLVLEFELRKAKETIHELREQITSMTAGNTLTFLSLDTQSFCAYFVLHVNISLFLLNLFISLFLDRKDKDNLSLVSTSEVI